VAVSASAGAAPNGVASKSKPPRLTISKTGPKTVPQGGVITWQITVTNNGPGSSSGFVVNDTLPAGITNVSTVTPGCVATGNAVQCTEGALADGSSFVIVVTGTAPAAAGVCVTNTATVTGNQPGPKKHTTSSVKTCTTPAISLAKTASTTAYSSVGTVITYTYTVTNTSTSLALSNVTVTDPMPGLSAIDCGSGTNVIAVLAAGASQPCTATYTTTSADLDAGSLMNTGTATGVTPGGVDITAVANLTIKAVQVPAVAIQKTADVQGYSGAGTPITYTYTVTNSGNVTLSNVTVTDPMPGLSSVDCGSGTNVVATLAAGASVVCTATYTTTANDAAAGSITNVGTVIASSSTRQVSSKASLTVPEDGQPFTCISPTDFLSQTNSPLPGEPTQLYYTTPTISTYVPLGTPFASTYNALGFDPIDHYLYATVVGSTEMIKIDSAGNVQPFGTIANYVPTSNTGAFDSSGNYWITNTGNGIAYEISAASIAASAPSATSLTLSQPFMADDWSLLGGYLWGLEGTTLYRVQISGVGAGTVSTFAAPPAVNGVGTSDPTFGAAWTFSNGDLGFSDNDLGTIFEISVVNPSAASPTFNVVASFPGPVAQHTNDGAACPGLPADLSIVKKAPKKVIPGGTVTWQITVTNNGAGNSSGFVVNDTLPAGITNVSTVTPGCVVTGTVLQCAEGALAVGSSFTIVVNGMAPPTSGSCVMNTASVIGNESDPNSKNNASTVKTCVSKVKK